MSTERHRQLFTGTASYYSRFRPTYPPELFDLIAKTFGLDGKGRLLDLGCGPGNVFFGLHQYFEEVVAVDINAEMLIEARLRAENLGVKNLGLLEQPAEEIGPDLGSFRLVTMGRSFHWMNRELVIGKVWELLETGGGIVLLGGDDSPQKPWLDFIVRGLVERWRVRERLLENDYKGRFEEFIGQSAFSDMQHGIVETEEEWGLEQIIGKTYSMSGSKPELFGENREAFERELRQALTLLEPSGRFVYRNAFGYVLAFKC
ncbi:MAG: class I SAM-dependent methyltransferase [Meiothermus sp.]